MAPKRSIVKIISLMLLHALEISYRESSNKFHTYFYALSERITAPIKTDLGKNNQFETKPSLPF